MTSRAKRVLLGIGIALASLNIWTGAPLAALWIGSRTQESSDTTLLGVFVVAILMIVFCLGLVWLLGLLNEAYDRVTGAPPKRRRQSPWMRAMSGERAADVKRRDPVTLQDRTLIISVVLAVIAFEIWLFFIAGSPLPHGA